MLQFLRRFSLMGNLFLGFRQVFGSGWGCLALTYRLFRTIGDVIRGWRHWAVLYSLMLAVMGLALVTTLMMLRLVQAVEMEVVALEAVVEEEVVLEVVLTVAAVGWYALVL